MAISQLGSMLAGKFISQPDGLFNLSGWPTGWPGARAIVSNAAITTRWIDGVGGWPRATWGHHGQGLA